MLLLTCHLQVPDSCPLSTYLEMKAECIPLCSSHVKGFLVSVIILDTWSLERLFLNYKSLLTCLSYVTNTTFCQLCFLSGKLSLFFSLIFRQSWRTSVVMVHGRGGGVCWKVLSCLTGDTQEMSLSRYTVIIKWHPDDFDTLQYYKESFNSVAYDRNLCNL